jgi:hypothetical protein
LRILPPTCILPTWYIDGGVCLPKQGLLEGTRPLGATRGRSKTRFGKLKFSPETKKTHSNEALDAGVSPHYLHFMFFSAGRRLSSNCPTATVPQSTPDSSSSPPATGEPARPYAYRAFTDVPTRLSLAPALKARGISGAMFKNAACIVAQPI